MERIQYLFKIIMIGDATVGKTSLLYHFVNDTQIYKPDTTIGVDFGCKIIKILDNEVKLQLWDTSGQEKFRSITRCYYRSAAGCVLMFDITNRISFENMKAWLRDVRIHCANEKLQFILVGNKIDIEDKRVISYKEAQDYSNENDLHYLETSALNGTNIQQLFYKLAENIYVSSCQDGLKENTAGIKIYMHLNEEPINRYSPCC